MQYANHFSKLIHVGDATRNGSFLRNNMSSRERTTKEKMIEFMEDSAFEVAAWPEWKRNTLFTGERGPLPTNPAAINRRLKLLEEQKLSIEKEMDKLNKMLKEKA